MKNYKKVQPEIKITILYLIFGFMWILFSGNLVYSVSFELEEIVTLERYKGWVFIFVTSVLLFMLIKKESTKQNILLQQLSESQEMLIERGKLLKDQNEQLKGFAFITSHNLRRPLANILGLVQLFNKEKSPDQENKLVIENISLMATELDQHIRESNNYLKLNVNADGNLK